MISDRPLNPPILGDFSFIVSPKPSTSSDQALGGVYNLSEFKVPQHWRWTEQFNTLTVKPGEVGI
jgi:hypothetical protein